MKKEFVNYNQALKLKAIGFDEPCFGFYLEDGTWTPASYSREGTVYPSNTDLLPEWCAAPLYQQVFRWFREEYGMIFTLIASTYYYPSVSFINTDGNSEIELGEFETYEEAELACLDKLIEMAHPNN